MHLRDQIRLAPAALRDIRKRFFIQKRHALEIKTRRYRRIKQLQKLAEERLQKLLEKLVLWHE